MLLPYAHSNNVELPNVNNVISDSRIDDNVLKMASQTISEMLQTSLCVRFDARTLALSRIILCLRKDDSTLSASIFASLEEEDKKILDEALIEISDYLVKP